MDQKAYLATPDPPPTLHIPDSPSTVEVRVIDTNTLVYLNPELFWQPKLPGLTGLHAPIYCFLISHGSSHVVFDLGVRPDWQNYAPKIVSLIQATTIVTAGSDVATVLDSDTSGLDVRSSDIESVIWSHNHFDHIGDISTFPPSTELVVGPGVCAASWPGWPRNPDAAVLDSDIQGRQVREIVFTGLKIGGFDAVDFFGDGSFYLLDSPGHAVGHLCALARTTADSPSFVFMGADACHHPGVLRPTGYLPLPRSIAPFAFSNDIADAADIHPHSSLSDDIADVPDIHQVLGVTATPCPGELLQQLTIGQSPNAPFFTVTRGPLFSDYDAAMDTVRKIQEFDAGDQIFVILAHDLSLRDRIPLFPATINGWRAENLPVDTRWLFCNDFARALRSKGFGDGKRAVADGTETPGPSKQFSI